MVTAPLSGRTEAVALDQLLLVVQLGPLDERQAQLLDRLERPHPQLLLFQGADRALDTATAFRSSYERWAGAQAQEADLVPGIIVDVLRAVIVPKLDPGGDLLADGAEAATYNLADRLECLPMRCVPGGVGSKGSRRCNDRR